MIGKWVFYSAITAILFGTGGPSWASEADEKAAQEVCDSWLVLTDKEQYRQSWDRAASIFKQSIAREQWDKQLKSTRGLMGKVVSRTVKSKEQASSLPGVPDGDYVIVQYETSFDKKKSAIETATAMKDKDGKWRVAGYFIK